MKQEQVALHRKSFEDLESSKGKAIHYDQLDEGRYFCEYQQNRWEGYLMYAENLEVELPAKKEMSGLMMSAWYEHKAFNYCIDRVIKSLESQGIKIKSSGS